MESPKVPASGELRFRVTLATRWSDEDNQNVLNNAVYMTLLEEARYAYFANLKFILQRLSALGLLAFLGAHLWLAFLKPRLFEGQVEPFADIAHEMHFHTPTLIVYILGVLAVAYHFGNGLHTAMMSWGVVETKSSMRRSQIVAWVAFIAMLVMGWGAIFALFQAGKLT